MGSEWEVSCYAWMLDVEWMGEGRRKEAEGSVISGSDLWRSGQYNDAELMTHPAAAPI